MAGAVIAYYSFNQIVWLKEFLIPFTAGGFLYIALVDLIPELHKDGGKDNIALQFITMIGGLLLMWLLKISFAE